MDFPIEFLAFDTAVGNAGTSSTIFSICIVADDANFLDGGHDFQTVPLDRTIRSVLTSCERPIG